jgi:hypothetical protein
MMPRRGQIRDLSGKRFGRLVVIRFAGRAGRQITWRCRCDCGVTTAVHGKALKVGATRSCGCLRHELAIARAKHGCSRKGKVTPEYRAWQAMFTRCSSKRPKWWRSYGSRGIKVCARWNSFEKFLKDMGSRPIGMSLDRKHNDKGYTPKNCRWATLVQQANNRRPRRPGTFVYGERCGTSKLTERQVAQIRAARKRGEFQASLAERFGVSQPTISEIVNYKYCHCATGE